MTFYLFLSESYYKSSEESRAGRRLNRIGPIGEFGHQPGDAGQRRILMLQA